MISNTLLHTKIKLKIKENSIRELLEDLSKHIQYKVSYTMESYNIDKISERCLSDVELLEDSHEIAIHVDVKKPYIILHNKNLLGSDGSSFVLRVHPFRIIIARSGIYLYSLKPIPNKISFLGAYDSTFSFVENLTGDSLEDAIKRAESRVLADLETRSVLQFIDEIDGAIDLVIMDGPLYHPVTYDINLKFLKELYYQRIPVIYIVKNSVSRRFTRLLGIPLLDSDFLAYKLRPNERTPAIIVKNILSDKGELIGIENKLRPVSFYYMSPKRILFRIDVPLWVVEDYLLENIVKWSISDILLGGGTKSFMISKAESVAKFSESEKKYIKAFLEKLLAQHGIISPSTYNQFRWGVF